MFVVVPPKREKVWELSARQIYSDEALGAAKLQAIGNHEEPNIQGNR